MYDPKQMNYTKREYDNLRAENKFLKEQLAAAEKNKDRMKAFILKKHPPNRHDHDYFHADCSLCQWEEKDYADVEQVLKPEVEVADDET